MLAGIVKTLRPRQWVKNLFVLAPVVFAKDLFHEQVLLRALLAFVGFSLLAGAIYTLNDIVDVEDDRQHPTKRNRPIASGKVPISVARPVAAALITFSLSLCFWLGVGVGLTSLAYLVLNLAYSFRLKKIAYVDVLCLSTFFMLRVLAGSFAVSTAAHPVRPSEYLILCTAFLAAFLGLGKRYHELQVNRSKARSALKSYNEGTLRFTLWVTALLTVGVYLAWTLDPPPFLLFARRYLWLTTPLVLVGIGRFTFLLRSQEGESPTDAMLRDVTFVVTVLLWAAVMITIIYQLRPTG